MKNLRTIILITGILVAGCAFNVAAQNRAERTASAKAYYGHRPQMTKFKKPKKQKVHNFTHTKPAKGTRTNSWATRRKYAHS